MLSVLLKKIIEDLRVSYDGIIITNPAINPRMGSVHPKIMALLQSVIAKFRNLCKKEGVKSNGPIRLKRDQNLIRESTCIWRITAYLFSEI